MSFSFDLWGTHLKCKSKEEENHSAEDKIVGRKRQTFEASSECIPFYLIVKYHFALNFFSLYLKLFLCYVFYWPDLSPEIQRIPLFFFFFFLLIKKIIYFPNPNTYTHSPLFLHVLADNSTITLFSTFLFSFFIF